MFMTRTAAHAKAVSNLDHLVHEDERIAPVTSLMEKQIEESVASGGFFTKCVVETDFPAMRPSDVALAYEKVSDYFKTKEYEVESKITDLGKHIITVFW